MGAPLVKLPRRRRIPWTPTESGRSPRAQSKTSDLEEQDRASFEKNIERKQGWLARQGEMRRGLVGNLRLQQKAVKPFRGMARYRAAYRGTPSGLAEFVDGGVYVGVRSSRAYQRARAARAALRGDDITRFFGECQKN